MEIDQRLRDHSNQHGTPRPLPFPLGSYSHTIGSDGIPRFFVNGEWQDPYQLGYWPIEYVPSLHGTLAEFLAKYPDGQLEPDQPNSHSWLSPWTDMKLMVQHPFATYFGYQQGKLQFYANAANGIQDSIIGTINGAVDAIPGSGLAESAIQFFSGIESFSFDIDSWDWSRDLFIDEGGEGWFDTHNWSKGLAAFGIETLSGLGGAKVKKAVGEAFEEIGEQAIKRMGNGPRIIDETVETVLDIVDDGHRLLPSEGEVGTYKDLINAGTKGDNITPHHIPSSNHLKQHNIIKNDGISINMEQPTPGSGGRHRRTFTYGNKADEALSSREALGRGVRDTKRIYEESGLYGPKIRKALQELIQQNKKAFPWLF